jgi:hypothetical protein
MSLRDVGTVKDTTVVTLRHPNPRKPDPVNADGTPMTVTVHGPYSARYKKVMRERQQKWLSESDRTGRQLSLTPEDVENTTRETIMACVETWDLTLEGDTRLPYNPETAAMVFEEFPWVYEQIASALGDISNFLDAPSTH